VEDHMLTCVNLEYAVSALENLLIKGNYLELKKPAGKPQVMEGGK
jgi:hypothetical protein